MCLLVGGESVAGVKCIAFFECGYRHAPIVPFGKVAAVLGCVSMLLGMGTRAAVGP